MKLARVFWFILFIGAAFMVFIVFMGAAVALGEPAVKLARLLVGTCIIEAREGPAEVLPLGLFWAELPAPLLRSRFTKLVWDQGSLLAGVASTTGASTTGAGAATMGAACCTGTGAEKVRPAKSLEISIAEERR
jgi:hypothetical protein